MSVSVILDVTKSNTHYVGVKLVVPAGEATRIFRLPAWVPGSYKIRDFGRHLLNFTATSDGKNCPVEQVGKDTWQVKRCKGAVTLEYRVYCRELTVDTSHVNSDHAHLFLPTLVVYDDATRNAEHQVKLAMPRGWQLFSGLETTAGSGKLAAATDYDHLIDCPIECGPKENFEVLSFEVDKKSHRIVLWQSPKQFDREAVTSDVKKIVEETRNIFGGLPYEHYTFIGHVAKGHGGGLEHRNSTVLGVDELHLIDSEWRETKFYPLVAHEFFHTWNVKRILPEAFQPYDLQLEQYTDLLWLFEGFTTYYELPILHRAGVVTSKNWGKLVAEMLKYYEMAEGRHQSSVCLCSRLTWTWLYQPFEENVNRNVSYYTKGLFVGLCLDAELRKRGHSKGLDVVMQHLWKKHGETGIGVPEDGLAQIVEEATGENVRRLLNSWTKQTSELPIDTALGFLGIEVERKVEGDSEIGLNIQFKSDGKTIDRIPAPSKAKGVLQPDDEVVAVDSLQFVGDRFSRYCKSKKSGETVEIQLFRQGRLRSEKVELSPLPKSNITISPKKKDAAGARRRSNWLGKARPEPKPGTQSQ